MLLFISTYSPTFLQATYVFYTDLRSFMLCFVWYCSCLDYSVDKCAFGCILLSLFLLGCLFMSPRLRLSGHYGREVNHHHACRSCMRGWYRSISGLQPDSFIQRRAGDLFLAEAAGLAVMLVNNE